MDCRPNVDNVRSNCGYNDSLQPRNNYPEKQLLSSRQYRRQMEHRKMNEQVEVSADVLPVALRPGRASFHLLRLAMNCLGTESGFIPPKLLPLASSLAGQLPDRSRTAISQWRQDRVGRLVAEVSAASIQASPRVCRQQSAHTVEDRERNSCLSCAGVRLRGRPVAFCMRRAVTSM